MRSVSQNSTDSNTTDSTNVASAGNRWLHIAILSVVVFGVWSFGIHGDFLWVDRVEILEAGYRVTNQEDAVKVWTQSLDAFLERQYGELNASGGYLRPVYAYSISLDWLLWPDNPLLYKVVNIVWHWLVVLGLYVLGAQLLNRSSDRHQVSFWAALLFAVHPFGVHSVTWISGRKDTLCAALAIAALILFGQLLRQSRKSLSKSILFMLLIGVSLNLAMFSKELAVVTPLFATIWLWMSFVKTGEPASSNRRTKPALLALVMMWSSSLFCFVYRHVMIGGIGLNAEHPSDSWLLNVATSCRLITYYVGRVLFPVDPTIVDRWRISGAINAEELIAIGFIVVVVLLIGYLVLKRIREGIALAWFGVWLLPATGLVPLNHVYAERYLYPAIWGLMLFVVMITIRGIKRYNVLNSNAAQGAIGAIAFLSVAIVFAAITLQSFRHWNSEATLFGHAVEQNPNYVEGQSALALHDLENKKFAESLEHSDRAIDSANDKEFKSYMSPQIIYSNSGLAALSLGDTDRAIKDFKEVCNARPNNSLSYYHLAKAYGAAGQHELAIENFSQAIKIWPGNHVARNDLGFVYLQTNEFQKCVDVLTPTVESSADNPLARTNLGSAHLMLKQFAEAIPHFEWLTKDNKMDALNLAKLAWCKYETGEVDEAKTIWMTAFEINPNDPVVRYVQQTYVRPLSK